MEDTDGSASVAEEELEALLHIYPDELQITTGDAGRRTVGTFPVRMLDGPDMVAWILRDMYVARHDHGLNKTASSPLQCSSCGRRLGWTRPRSTCGRR